MKKNSQLKPNHKIIKLILHNYFTPPFGLVLIGK